uniref:Uncharacterized protein n=1 Tax=Knipowitschia caucasica TaxID=637954 RepID=A0AAV2JNN5_KNICA
MVKPVFVARRRVSPSRLSPFEPNSVRRRPPFRRFLACCLPLPLIILDWKAGSRRFSPPSKSSRICPPRRWLTLSDSGCPCATYAAAALGALLSSLSGLIAVACLLVPHRRTVRAGFYSLGPLRFLC